MNSWANIKTIAKRELAAYFTSPLAYVFIVIFLLLCGFFTFMIGGLWGYQYYRPDHYASVQPFLAAYVLLLAFAYHAWTWFRIMPRTLPPIRWRGARVAAATITRIGLGAALVASALLYVLVARLAA
mgnify:CR=1 FL=1